MYLGPWKTNLDLRCLNASGDRHSQSHCRSESLYLCSAGATTNGRSCDIRHRLIGIERDCYSFIFEDNCWPLVNRKVPVHIMHTAFDICSLRPARCWANKPWNSLARPLLGQSTRRPGAAQQGFTDRKRWLDMMKHDQVALFVAFQFVLGTCVIIYRICCINPKNI